MNFIGMGENFVKYRYNIGNNSFVFTLYNIGKSLTKMANTNYWMTLNIDIYLNNAFFANCQFIINEIADRTRAIITDNLGNKRIYVFCDNKLLPKGNKDILNDGYIRLRDGYIYSYFIVNNCEYHFNKNYNDYVNKSLEHMPDNNIYLDGLIEMILAISNRVNREVNKSSNIYTDIKDNGLSYLIRINHVKKRVR